MTSAIALHNTLQVAKGKAFSLAIRRSFAAWGAHSTITPPARLTGTERITVGSEVVFAAGSWLQTHQGGTLTIDDGARSAGDATISAAERIHIGACVLLSRNVHILDNLHAREDGRVPIRLQGIADVAPVIIREGAWLGANVVVLPGVTVGKNAVVGANAVVNRDVPDRAVAVGVPAHVVSVQDPHL